MSEQTDWHKEYAEILGREPTKEDEQAFIEMLPSPLEDRAALNRIVRDVAFGSDPAGIRRAMVAARNDLQARQEAKRNEESLRRQQSRRFWRWLRNMALACVLLGVLAGAGLATYMATKDTAVRVLMTQYDKVAEYRARTEAEIEAEIEARRTALEITYKEKMIAISGSSENPSWTTS